MLQKEPGSIHMVKNRPLALLMLFLVLIILGHSVVCLFQGKFQQAMVMSPLLIIVYVFGLARKDEPESDSNPREAPPPDLREDEDDGRK